MNKLMTQEVAIKSAWMILEGLGFSREINGDLEKTVTAVYESAPAAVVVEVVRCKDCIHRDPEDRKCDCGGQERQGCPLPVRGSYFCAHGKRKDGGQDE